MEVLGVFSLGALAKFRSPATVPTRLTTALLALAFLVLGLMIWTAGLGGRIRHPEIGAANSAAQMRLGWRNGKPDESVCSELLLRDAGGLQAA